jgi:bacillithiol biosynthesis cysteine-adding enzyme BshC
MKIEWEESVPLAKWLPRRSPLRRLLEGGLDVPGTEHFRFSADIGPPPPPRAISPLLHRRLEEYHREAGASPQSLANVALLGSGAQAVVTGQQTGLLGGPFLTLLKALTAVHLAAELTRREGRPFVPVFWAESEDHDIEEMNQATTLDGDSRPARFELPCPEEFRGGPAGRIPLGEEAAALVDRFLALSGETEFTAALRSRILGDLEGAADLSRWFCRQMLRLFGDRGLVVLESGHRPYKKLARPLWVRVLEDPLALTEGVRRAGEEIARQGCRPVLFKEKRRAPFFLIEGGQRLPVFFERGSFRVGDRHYTPLELRSRLDEKPEEFSPGVNLRPLLQDSLLPTAAYVGGPTELAYFLQVIPGYHWAEIPPPALVLRAGVTLVEPSVRKLLQRRGIKAAALRKGIDGVLDSLVRGENRLADPARWEKMRLGTLRPLEKFSSSLPAAEKEVAQLADRTKGKVDFLLRELEKRSVASLRRRSELLQGQLSRARNRLFPGGALQERVLSPCYFLNRHGPELIEILAERLPTDFTRHHFGTIIPRSIKKRVDTP